MPNGKHVRRVCFPFVGDTIGGSHLSALSLISHLDLHRYEPLIVLHKLGPLAEHLRARGMHFELLTGIPHVHRGHHPPRIVLSILLGLRRYMHFLGIHDVAIVHTHDARMHLTWSVPARLGGCRFVWHQRTVFPNSRSMRWIAQMADKVICISDFTTSSLPPRLRERATIITNPFETTQRSLSRKEARSALLGDLRQIHGGAVVGFVGNLTAQKRPLVFVEAAAEIARRRKEHDVFPMFGKDREQLADTVRKCACSHGIEDRIHLMGFKSPIEPCLAACDILVAPGVSEGFGRTLVEAMLVGTAVVAVDSGGHKEIIVDNETGFIVPPDDPKALADAVLTLLEDPDRARMMADKGRQRAVSHWDSESHARHVAALYDELLCA